MDKKYEILYKSKEFNGIHTTYIFANNSDEAKNKFYKLGFKDYVIVSIKRIDHKEKANIKRILGKHY